jgi:hypothetical protein
MRSRLLPVLAPLALLLSVTLAACDSSSGAAGARSNAVVPPAPQTDVHAIDWRDATYTVTCSGLGSPQDQQVPVTLAGGTGKTAPVSWFGASMPLDIAIAQVAYGDLTGDGKDDAVVHLTCNPDGSNGVADEIQVFGPGDELLGKPVLVNRFASDFAPAVRTLAVSGNHLSGTASYWKADDPHCCPSATLPFSFTWNPSTRTFTAA